MSQRAIRILGLLVLAAAMPGAGCGGSSTTTGDSGHPGCVPNQGVACLGRGGCAGWQICAADGSSYSECVCFQADGGPDASLPGDAAAGGDAAPEGGRPPDAAPPADAVSPGDAAVDAPAGADARPPDAAAHDAALVDAPAATDGFLIGDGAVCAAESVVAQHLPLDIYIMLDQSGSMTDAVGNGTKWTAVTGAIESFVSQTGLDGTAVGLQYFGLPASGVACNVQTCTVDADCGDPSCGPCVALFGCTNYGGAGDSCNAADYAVAAVEIAPLPGVAAAIQTSIQAHSPTTSTPTSAALQGAVDHAHAWAVSHPEHVAIVVFATDGDPTECDTSLPDINAIAAAGLAGTPSVRTFVIGVGASLGALNDVAAAGGTTAAFMVDTGANVNAQILAALNGIRGTALGCTYALPALDGGTADITKVNVQYKPGAGGAPQLIPQAPDQAHCTTTSDAWYYDNATAPTQIILCPATCSKVSADATGEVDVLLGCKSTVPQ